MRTASINEWSDWVRRLVDRQFAGSQAELARSLGISSQAVSRWVNHGATPRYPVLMKLAHITGRPVAELQALANGVPPDDPSLHAHAAEVARRSPNEHLDTYLAKLLAAKQERRITAREYKSALEMITLAAEMQLERIARKET